jgi:Ca-activated chloride channel homolog
VGGDMKSRTRLFLTVAATLCLSLFSWTTVLAAGLLVPKDGSIPALDIRDHLVDVVIEDGYAVTTAEQVFHNPHDRDL